MRRALVLASLVATGCGAVGPEMVEGFDPPGPKGAGLQIITAPIRGVPPATNIEYCTWTDQIADRDIDVRSTSPVIQEAETR